MLTKAEQSLVRDGQSEFVLRTRLAFQQTMRGDFVQGAQKITGAKVRAFLSSNHVDPDIAVQTFILEEPLSPEQGQEGVCAASDGGSRNGSFSSNPVSSNRRWVLALPRIRASSHS
jgi:hypothetical protein